MLSSMSSVSSEQTLRLAEGSVARKKQCPALDFEQLKLRLGQLTASKKTKPDVGVEIPDSRELAQTAGVGFSPFVCPLSFQQPLSAAAPDGLTSMDGAAILSANLAPAVPFLGQTSSLEGQEQLCSAHAHAVELTEQSQPIQPLPSASISDSGKAFAFPSAPGLPGFPPINTQPMLDPHQLYAYINALQSQLQLNPVDLLLLSAIQQGQHTASYNNLYRQLLQQTYANSNPALGHLPPSLVVNPAQFHPMFGSMLYDWPMPMMVGGLPGLVQPMVFAGNQPSVPDATQKPISDVMPRGGEASVLPSSVAATGREATTDEILTITENKQQRSFEIGILDQKDLSGSGIQQTVFTSGQILTSACVTATQRSAVEMMPDLSNVELSRNAPLQALPDLSEFTCNDKNFSNLTNANLSGESALQKFKESAKLASDEIRCNSASIKRSQSLIETSNSADHSLQISPRSLLRLRRKLSVDALREASREANAEGSAVLQQPASYSSATEDALVPTKADCFQHLCDMLDAGGFALPASGDREMESGPNLCDAQPHLLHELHQNPEVIAIAAALQNLQLLNSQQASVAGAGAENPIKHLPSAQLLGNADIYDLATALYLIQKLNQKKEQTDPCLSSQDAAQSFRNDVAEKESQLSAVQNLPQQSESPQSARTAEQLTISEPLLQLSSNAVPQSGISDMLEKGSFRSTEQPQKSPAADPALSQSGRYDQATSLVREQLMSTKPIPPGTSADGSLLPSNAAAEIDFGAQLQSQISAAALGSQLQAHAGVLRLALHLQEQQNAMRLSNAPLQPVSSVGTDTPIQLSSQYQLHMQPSVLTQAPTKIQQPPLPQQTHIQLSQQKNPLIVPSHFPVGSTLPFQAEVFQQPQPADIQADLMAKLLSKLQAQQAVMQNLAQSQVQTPVQLSPLVSQMQVQADLMPQTSQISNQTRLPQLASQAPMQAYMLPQAPVQSAHQAHLTFQTAQMSAGSKVQDQTQTAPQSSPLLQHEAHLHDRAQHLLPVNLPPVQAMMSAQGQISPMMLGQLSTSARSLLLHQQLSSVHLLQQQTSLPHASGNQTMMIEEQQSLRTTLNQSQLAWLYAQHLDKALLEAPPAGNIPCSEAMGAQPNQSQLQRSVHLEVERTQYDEYLLQLKEQQQLQQLLSGIQSQPSSIPLYPSALSSTSQPTGAGDLNAGAVAAHPMPQIPELHPVIDSSLSSDDATSLPVQHPSKHPPAST